MANRYEWDFPTFITNPSIKEDEHVVHTVFWVLTGYDDMSGYKSQVQGMIELEHDVESAFVSFDKLSSRVVEGWVVTKLGNQSLEAYRNHIDQKIQEQITPKNVYLAPPWKS